MDSLEKIESKDALESFDMEYPYPIAARRFISEKTTTVEPFSWNKPSKAETKAAGQIPSKRPSTSSKESRKSN